MAQNEKKQKKVEGYFQKAVKSLEFSGSFLNMTNEDPDMCAHLCSLGVVDSFLSIIEGQLARGIYSKVMNESLDILFNVSKVDSYVPPFDFCFPRHYSGASLLSLSSPLPHAGVLTTSSRRRPFRGSFP